MRIPFIALFALLLTISLPFSLLAAETRGLRVVAKDPATNESGEVKLYNKTYAVIIGIDRYADQRIKPLSYAVRDAKGIEETLLKYYKFDEIIPLYNEQATRERILEVLTYELPARMGEDDALFVFWAGHGNQEGKEGREIGYLIPYDGSLVKLLKNVSMTDFKGDISSKIPAKHIFYVMDACYSGLLTATRSVDTKTRRDLKYLKEITKENVRQVLTAGSKGQEVLDSGGYKGHSVFTGRLIQVLEANSDFKTANEIQAIVTEHVFNDAKASSHSQKPDYARLSGNGDFVFIPSRDYQLQQLKAGQEDRQKDIDKSVREQEKLNREMTELAELEKKANSANDERARQRIEDNKRIAEARLAQERLRQQALEDEKRRDAQQQAELKRIDDERNRQLEEARQMEAKFSQDDEKRQSELQRLEQEQLNKKQDEEQKLAALRKQADERRRTALQAAAGSLSIEAAVSEIKATDTRIAGIRREFEVELSRQKSSAEARLNEKLTLLKQSYDKRMLALGQQKKVTVARPVIPPKDPEFETDAEYRERAAKVENDYQQRLAEASSSGSKIRQAEEDAYTQATRQAKEKYAEEIAALESRTKREQEAAVKPFQERIAAIAAKEYLVAAQSLKLTVGAYNPEKGFFPVSISSSSPGIKLAVDGILSLPRDSAKLFKQQYLSGLVRAEAAMRIGNDQPVRVAMLNDGVKSDADEYLLELEDGSFISVAAKKRALEFNNERQKALELQRERLRELLKESKNPDAMVKIAAGCFTVNGQQVCLDAFRIGKYEVTQGLWKDVVGNNPSHFKDCGDYCPVESVSWNDTQEFLKKLNSKTGNKYRLPTEAEWHYACSSGGKNEEYCGGNDVDAVAWYGNNSGSKTHPVGQKQPNGLGIYDMSGNVWEWCSDWEGSSYPSGSKNPNGASSWGAKEKVLRGGSWSYSDWVARALYRGGSGPGSRGYIGGFRLAISED